MYPINCVSFKRVFRARGIDRPYSYLVKLGYSNNLASRIANNRVYQFNLTQVEKLYEILKCTPNDLLQWIPEKKDVDIENHPLISMIRTDKVTHLTKLLNSVPLDKLSEIEEMIKKEVEK